MFGLVAANERAFALWPRGKLGSFGVFTGHSTTAPVSGGYKGRKGRPFGHPCRT
jgi:hypothetical protein